MSYTRREFGKIALAGLPAAALVGRGESIFGGLVQAKPNSLINGVQIGTITYSYRSMPDQSAEATLRYIVDSGISAIELMGGPVESYAGAPADGRGGGAGRGAGGPGGPGARVRPAAGEPRSIRRIFRPARSSASGTVASAPFLWTEANRARPELDEAAADAAVRQLRNNRPRSRRRSRRSKRGGRRSRWIRSRSCGRCTTTPA